MFALAILILFWVMLLSNMITAMVFGQRLERGFAVLLCLISVGMVIANALVSPAFLASIGSGSDILILLIAWILALKSDRYWPIWFAAMQSLSVITHFVSLIVDGVPHLIFSNLAAVWALPALLTMSWGTIQDWRARRPGRAAPLTDAASG
ncbi:hypothetical protein [Novosphingobium olei]|uniref:hypothetical protein n=1 Tax=Novosphingobium olei TaxID=2728851 RepID=UPI00308F29EE|nr:hypothetical protein NSDW_09670 [Novosphingobium olei]